MKNSLEGPTHLKESVKWTLDWQRLCNPKDKTQSGWREMDRASEKHAPFCINLHVVGVPGGGKGAENKLQRNNGWKHPRDEDSKSTSQELSDSQAENTKRRISVKMRKQRQRGKSESSRRGIPLKLIPDIPEATEARRRWCDTPGVLKSRVVWRPQSFHKWRQMKTVFNKSWDDVLLADSPY